MGKGKKKQAQQEEGWIYKRKRGLYVRWGSVGTSMFLALYGLRSLYISMRSDSWWKKTVEIAGRELEIPNPILDEQWPIKVGVLGSMVLAAAMAYGLMWLFFRHQRVSEFMIDTETEMRKVSWPSWEQLKTSTVATVVAVFLLGVYLYVVDVVFSRLFQLAFNA